MAYPAVAIANEILTIAMQNGQQVTPMQMQKLVYFAHGWNLAIAGDPLIAERIEAWEYGPVVASLYRELRRYGSKAITQPITEPDLELLDFSTRVPCIDDGPNLEINAFSKALVQKIWDTYAKFDAFQLSEMTHVPGSPWSNARDSGKPYIPDDQIRDYFKSLELAKQPVAAIDR